MHRLSTYLYLAFRRVRWPYPLALGILITLIMVHPNLSPRASEPNQKVWDLRLFGPLRVEYDGREIPHRLSVRERALLGYLALAGAVDDAHWPTMRIDLADEIWNEHENWGQRTVGANRLATDTLKDLAAAASRLSGAFEKPVERKGALIQRSPDSIRLDQRFVRTDVGRFATALRMAKLAKTPAVREEQLASAVFVYEGGAGDLLPGVETKRIGDLRDALRLDYVRAKDDLAKLRGAHSVGELEQRDEFLAQQNALLTADLIAKASHARQVPGEETWMDKLDARRWSCIAAIEREIAVDREPSLIENAALSYVWVRGGHGPEMRDWFVRKLKTPGAVAPIPRAWVHRAIGLICSNLGEIEASRQQFMIALELFRKLNHKQKTAGALMHLSYLLYSQGKKEESVRCGLEAYNILSNMTDAGELVVFSLALSERLYGSGRAAQGIALARHGLELADRIGTEREKLRARIVVAGLVAKEGQSDSAIRYLRTALDRSISCADHQSESMALQELAFLHRAHRRFDQSTELLKRAVRANVETNEEPGALSALLEYLHDASAMLHENSAGASTSQLESERIATLLCAYQVRMKSLGIVRNSDAILRAESIRNVLRQYTSDRHFALIQKQLTSSQAKTLVSSL